MTFIRTKSTIAPQPVVHIWAGHGLSAIACGTRGQDAKCGKWWRNGDFVLSDQAPNNLELCQKCEAV